jgi:hypothetical protein
MASDARPPSPLADARGSVAATAAVMLALAATLFMPLPGWRRAPWIGCFEDLVHVPMFAAFAWLLRRLTGRGPLTAAALALALAVVVEPLQGLVGRSSTFDDVVRGACGIAMYLGWSFAAEMPSRGRRWATRVAATLIGFSPLAPMWPTLWDAWQSWRQFPVLADFSSEWQTRRWWTRDGALDCRRDASGQGVGVLTAAPEPDRAPTMVLFPTMHDWSPYRRLHVEFTVEGEPLPIIIAVRDGVRVQPPLVRFDLVDEYDAGRHDATMDLGALARGGGNVAPLDVSSVQSFHIVLETGGEPRVLRLHKIWLE